MPTCWRSPKSTRPASRIDWYAPIEGEARRFADLDEAERARVLDEVQRLHGDIASLAQSMESFGPLRAPSATSPACCAMR